MDVRSLATAVKALPRNLDPHIRIGVSQKCRERSPTLKKEIRQRVFAMHSPKQALVFFIVVVDFFSIKSFRDIREDFLIFIRWHSIIDCINGVGYLSSRQHEPIQNQN